MNCSLLRFRGSPVTNCFCGLILLFSFAPPHLAAQQATAVSSVSNRTVTPELDGEHPLDQALRMANASLRHLRDHIKDYEAVFVKRCRVDGVMPELQYAKVKIRNRKTSNGQTTTPFSVYLNFLRPEAVQGREVLWVEGQNNGNMIAHEAGLKGMINVHLDPNGYLAMRGQRHPINEIGIENLLVKLIETGLRDRQHGPCEVEFFSNAKIRDTACTMLQVVHHEKRPYFDFHIARIYFDKSLNIPIRYESWSWPETEGGQPILEEEYTYLDVNVNVGLDERDFDIANPAYQFR